MAMYIAYMNIHSYLEKKKKLIIAFKLWKISVFEESIKKNLESYFLKSTCTNCHIRLIGVPKRTSWNPQPSLQHHQPRTTSSSRCCVHIASPKLAKDIIIIARQPKVEFINFKLFDNLHVHTYGSTGNLTLLKLHFKPLYLKFVLNL